MARFSCARMVVLAAGLLAASCSGANSGSNDATPGTSDGNTLPLRQKVSECRGFGATLPYGEVEVSSSPSAYCDAEVVAFRHDAATSTLTLYHRRVSLNCCGDRSVVLKVEQGVYRFIESDQPTADGGRCRCDCVFDFAVQVDNVPAGTIPLAIELNIAEESGPREVWSGALDLTKGSGEFVVSTDPAWTCGR